jgi:glycosyltransferase involved in cell wall biosynthesis
MKIKTPEQVLWDSGLRFEKAEMIESIARAMIKYHRQFKKAKSVMVYTNRSLFVKFDIDSLGCREYRVKTTKWGYLKELFYFLTHRFDIYYCWFGDLHALIPCLFSRLYFGRSVIFIGGYDGCYIPEIDYGVFRGNLREKVIRFVYKLAHGLVFVSNDIRDRMFSFIPVKSYKVIPLGMDIDFWKPEETDRDIDYIMVANVKDHNTFVRKGVDRFINLSRLYWDKKFVIIGWDGPPSHNFQVIKFVDADKLKAYLNRSRYYLHLSRYDASGSSLCAAILMECIPLVTDQGGARQMIGECKETELGGMKLLTPLKARRTDYILTLEERRDAILSFIETL